MRNCKRGKEVTHPRMEALGTLCTMQASVFDRGSLGLRDEGCKVTDRIRETLGTRWTGGRRGARGSSQRSRQIMSRSCRKP